MVPVVWAYAGNRVNRLVPEVSCGLGIRREYDDLWEGLDLRRVPYLPLARNIPSRTSFLFVPVSQGKAFALLCKSLRTIRSWANRKWEGDSKLRPLRAPVIVG